MRQLRYYHTEGALTLILFSSCGEWRGRRLGNTQWRINVLKGDDGLGADVAGHAVAAAAEAEAEAADYFLYGPLLGAADLAQ